MTYLVRNHSSLSGITDTLSAAAKVVEDPCLGQVAALVLELHSIEQTAKPLLPGKPAPPRTASAPVKGIGLCQAVTPLKYAIKIRKKPWVAYASLASVVAGLVLLGYGLGKMK